MSEYVNQGIDNRPQLIKDIANGSGGSKMKIVGIIFALLTICLFSLCTYVADSDAAVINASSCSYADVTAAYSTASAGDIIAIPAGECNWSSQLMITKAITLKGAGGESTKINHNYAGNLIALGPIADVAMRITGIYFYSSTNNVLYPSIYAKGSTQGLFRWTKLRIDHNKFNKGGMSVYAHGWVEGVIDNNIFINCNIAVFIGGDGTYSWSREIKAGTGNALFIEDNTFLVNNSADREPNQQIYHQEGGRTVTRYNTFDMTSYTSGNTYLYDSHGNWGTVSGTPDYRGQPIVEVYNNIMKGHHFSDGMDFRGGSILFHHNTISLIIGVPYISLWEEEAWTGGGPFCPSCPKFTVWPSWDNITNSFFWENTFNGTTMNESNYTTYMKLKYPATEAQFIQKDRDYFIHAPQSSGGKSTYPTTPGKYDMTFSSSGANAYYPYTPYTYPHPLTAPSPPLNLKIGQ